MNLPQPLEEKFKTLLTRYPVKRSALIPMLLFAQESMYWLTGCDTSGYIMFRGMYLGAYSALALLTRSAEKNTPTEDPRPPSSASAPSPGRSTLDHAMPNTPATTLVSQHPSPGRGDSGPSGVLGAGGEVSLWTRDARVATVRSGRSCSSPKSGPAHDRISGGSRLPPVAPRRPCATSARSAPAAPGCTATDRISAGEPPHPRRGRSRSA